MFTRTSQPRQSPVGGFEYAEPFAVQLMPFNLQVSDHRFDNHLFQGIQDGLRSSAIFVDQVTPRIAASGHKSCDSQGEEEIERDEGGPSLLGGEIREAPHISQSDRRAHRGGEETEGTTPLLPRSLRHVTPPKKPPERESARG